MAVVTLLPDGTSSIAGWSIVGAATAHAALSDASDATYVTDNITGTSHTILLTFATSILPSGAVIKKATPKFRASQAAGVARCGPNMRTLWPTDPSKYLYGPIGTWQRPTSTIADITNNSAAGAYLASPDPAHPTWTPQVVVDGLSLLLLAHPVDVPPSGTDDIRVYKVWIDVEYNEQPVATSVALDPAGVNTVSPRPGFTWVCSDPEGDPQVGRRVVLWTTADFNDLNCPDANAVSFVATDGTTRTAIAHSGGATDPTEYSGSNSWACPVDLTATGTYTLCVQLADQVGDQIRFANAAGTGTLSFTMAITPPPTPTLSGVAWDQFNYRTQLTVAAINNLLDADTADNEVGSATSWLQNFNAAGGVTQTNTPTAFNGTFSRRWISGGVGATDSSIVVGAFYKCIGSAAYSFHYRGRSSAASRNHQIQIQWYAADQTTLGGAVISGSTAVNNAGWTEVKFQNVVSPSTARYFKMFLNAVATGATESNYTDAAGAYPGTTVPAWTRGGLVDSQRIIVERSTDVGVTWWGLPQMTTLNPGVAADGSVNQTLIVYDLANRHNTPARYRARTTHNDGTYTYTSANSATAGPVTPSFDIFVLRDPTDPNLTMPCRVQGSIRSSSTERVGVFEILYVAAPVFVSQVVGTERMQVPIRLVGEPEWQTLLAIRNKMSSLILQTDMDTVAWWVRLGAQMDTELSYTKLRVPAATRARFVNLEMIIGNGPQGQPTVVP